LIYSEILIVYKIIDYDEYAEICLKYNK